MNIFLSFLKKYNQAVNALILAAIIVDILLIQFKSDVITFTIFGLYIILFRFYKFTSQNMFILCFIPLGIILFGFLIDPGFLGIEKASVWLFLIMGAGIVTDFFKLDKK